MKKLFLILMVLLLSIPIWASEHTVTINRGEGLFGGGTGVYYCVKDGIMMTFTSGLDNENYLVEHQQVNFEINSYNYIIKRIVFHCVDSTTSSNLDCFYWGPKTISIVQNFYNQNEPGNLSTTDYTCTWTGESNHMQFTTMAKPVRFGSIEIVYDKLDGDIFDLVTSTSQIVDGKTYILVTQNDDRVMRIKLTDDATYPSTPIVEWMGPSGSEKTRVKVDGNAALFRMDGMNADTLSYMKAAWFNTLNGYIRTASNSGSSTTNLTLTTGLTNYNRSYFYVAGSSTLNNFLARFNGNTSFYIRYNPTAQTFMGYTSISDSNTRVWLYKLAEAYNITTVCDPASGGTIDLGDGAVNSTSQQGETVNFTVTPADGYSLTSVTVTTDAGGATVAVTDNGDGTYSFVMPAEDVTVTANFEVAGAYQIFTENTPAGGGVVLVGGDVTTVDDNNYANGDANVTVTPNANWGWEATGVTVTDENDNAVTATPDGNGGYSCVMPEADVTVHATYKRVIGDIFDLVTSGSQIVEGNTYIIVTQNYDKVMKYWTPGQTTFSSTDIVDWPLGSSDKSKVRVDDAAVFFRMDNLNADTTTTGGLNMTRAAYLNTMNGYMRTQDYNVFLSSPLATENRGSMMVSNTAFNYLLKFTYDNTSGGVNTNWVVRYNNADGNFNVLNWTNDALTRIWLYKLAESYLVTAVCDPADGGSITFTHGVDENSKAQGGETVDFTVTTNDGYNFNGVTVTYTDGTTGTITVTDNGDGTYSFVMPDAAVTVTANFTAVTYNITSECDPASGAGSVNINNNGASATSVAGAQVNVHVSTIWGWRIKKVVAVNQATNETIPLELVSSSDDQGNDYTFTMPAADVHIVASFYKNLFLLGTAMGCNWCAAGPEFNYDVDNDQYYLDVYYKGVRDVSGQSDDMYGHFSLAQHIDAGTTWQTGTGTNNWSNVSGRLNAYVNDYDVQGGSTDVDLYDDRPDSAFRIPAGVYRIIVNEALTKMSIVETPLGLYFDPVSGSIVESGQQVVITSNLQDTVHSIANHYGIQEVAAQFRNSLDGGDSWDNDNTAVITAPGTTTVTAEAWIGYIIVPGTAYYIIPTPLAYIEDEIPPGTDVVVSDALIGAWAVNYDNAETGKRYRLLWARDEALSITPTYINPLTQGDYVMHAGFQTSPWLQNNWVALDFSDYPDADIEDMVNTKFKAGTVRGLYNDGENYTIKLTALPDTVGETAGEYGYYGYCEDQNEEKHSDYLYNHYMAFNFNAANLNVGNNDGAHPGVGSVVQDTLLFFMNPKIQEVAHVMGVWMGTGYNGNDVFTVYTQQGTVRNGFDLSGSFYVEWTYNRLSSSDKIFGKPIALADTAYTFHAAVTRSAYDPGTPLSLTAPKPTAPDGSYMVYPLDLPSRPETPTAIQEFMSLKQIVDVRYYNLMGIGSSEPFEGINVVVTRYSDGSISTMKIAR